MDHHENAEIHKKVKRDLEEHTETDTSDSDKMPILFAGKTFFTGPDEVNYFIQQLSKMLALWYLFNPMLIKNNGVALIYYCIK